MAIKFLFLLVWLTTLLTGVEGGQPVYLNLQNGTQVSPAVRDDATVSANIYTISCSDTTDGFPVQYQLTAVQPFNPVFQVTTFSGVVSYDVLLAQGTPMFDYLTAPNYFLTIVCSQAGFAVSATLTVPIEQINKPPEFVTPIITYNTVPENTLLPIVVFTNSATDPQGLSITYSADAVGSWKNANFKTDSAGRVYLIPNTNLNRSFATVYYVNELAYNIYATSSISLTVSVIAVNHAPYFRNLPNLVQLSDQTTTSTNIFRFSWHDEDDLTYSNTYGWSFNSNPASGAGKFVIDGSGNLFALPQQTFDASYEPTYVLTVYLTDTGSPQYTATGTLTINIVPFPTTQTETTTEVTTTNTETTTTTSEYIDTDVLIGVIAGVVGGLLLIGAIVGLVFYFMRSNVQGGGLAYRTGPLVNNSGVRTTGAPPRDVVVQGLNKSVPPPPAYRR